MDIVYKLTNITKLQNKEDGPIYYIGSKTECILQDLNEIPTIFNIRTNRPYFGSSSNIKFKEDLKKGHLFSAEILEKSYKDRLLKCENSYIIKEDAVSSDKYYNLAYAQVGGYSYDKTAIANIYGEDLKSLAQSKSNHSKKRNTAKKYGFNTLYDLCIFLKNHKDSGQPFAVLDKKYGSSKSYFARVHSTNNIEDTIKELKTIDKEKTTKQIREMLNNNASISKISEMLGITYLTCDHLISDWVDNLDKSYLAAIRNNLSETELGIKIVEEVLKGSSIFNAGKKYNLDNTTTRRYFLKCIRRNLKDIQLI